MSPPELFASRLTTTSVCSCAAFAIFQRSSTTSPHAPRWHTTKGRRLCFPVHLAHAFSYLRSSHIPPILPTHLIKGMTDLPKAVGRHRLHQRGEDVLAVTGHVLQALQGVIALGGAR